MAETTKQGEMEKGEGVLAEGLINEESLKKFASRVGMKMHIGNIYNQLVSADSIRHYVDGIGDVNPLYRDRDYALKTRYRSLIAPPNWLYSVFPTWVNQGLPGVHAFHSGNDWEFYHPLYEGDFIIPENTFTGFEEKKSQFAGRLVMEYQEARFFNQRKELVAKTKLWITRAERKAARQSGKYHSLQLPHPWKEEELKALEDEVLAEEVRGANPRFWEDVRVGDDLKPVVKGPLGLTDMIAYCAGSTPVQLMAHGVGLRLYRRHPDWAFRDPMTCALEPAYAVHYNLYAARGAGVPYPYDVGAQRQCWLINLLTNWMGDDGWIKKNYAEYRRFVYLSDAVRLTGKVTRKYVDADGDHCVDIETHSMNQREEDVMPGHSTIALPSRDKGTFPVDRHLRK